MMIEEKTLSPILVSKLVLLLTTTGLLSYVDGGQLSSAPYSSPSTSSIVPLWILRNRESVSRCALIEMTAFFEITYQTQTISSSQITSTYSSDMRPDDPQIEKERGEVSKRRTNLTLSSDASLSVASDSHECLPDDKGFLHLDLSFGRLHNLVLLFRLDGDHYQLYALALEYTINQREFPGHRFSRGVTAVSLRRLDSFRTSLGTSYGCKSEQRIKLEGTDQVTMVVKDLKFEVFNPRSDMRFSPSTQCDLDVPSLTTREIVVGGSFFLFISSLLIICLIRRFRKRQKAADDVLPLPDKPGFDQDKA